MKPVNYQSMPSSVNCGHPDLALDRVLSTSNVMYCEKCGFASTDPAVFKKHMIEHMGARFYCFYCNNVSFSEAELNAHLKQHTSKYPFKCPHCGQGYMRRLCLVKHIERLHSKNICQGSAKPGTTKLTVSSALPSVPTADPSSLRPAVQVTVPIPSAAAVRLSKDEQWGKTPDTNASNAINGHAELYSPLNGLIQHNRALTVSLPEEVTIPAGCLVELVEVKTVNGTKELKLRLVSQQENESVIKDTRTAASQNTALGKPLSSTSNYPNTVKSMSLGMCTVNRKQCETKTVNVERPAVVPVNVSKNLQNQREDKGGLKRTSQEIINLECHTVIPSKVPKNTLNPAREGNSGIKVTHREPVNHNAAPPTVTSTRVTNRFPSIHLQNTGTCVSQRAVDERKTSILEHSKSITSRKTSDIKSIPRDVSVAVKMEPGVIRPKNGSSKVKKEAAGLKQQSFKSASPSLSVPSAAAVKVRPPALSVCKDNVADLTFSVPRTLIGPSSVKAPVLSNRTNSKMLAWNQEVRSSERAGEGDVAEPEGFPVISSVFSLSQQPEDVQGSIQPLVMALRGIVMNKSNTSASTTRDHIRISTHTEQAKKRPTTGSCAEVATKDGSTACTPLLTKQTSESVKVEEHDKGIQHPALTHSHTHVKEEKNSTAPTDNNKCCHTPVSKSSRVEQCVSKIAAHVDAPGTANSLQQKAKSENDISSKFLTVSLKRVQVGVWKKNKKGLKLRISKYKTQVPMCSLTNCTVIYPMPLKVDQLVKRPGPYQPVVVLNHPKPRASVRGARADTLTDAGASEAVPKCQILKMRLGKVMGQKYEVMGCTVGVSP